MSHEGYFQYDDKGNPQISLRSPRWAVELVLCEELIRQVGRQLRSKSPRTRARALARRAHLEMCYARLRRYHPEYFDQEGRYIGRPQGG